MQTVYSFKLMLLLLLFGSFFFFSCLLFSSHSYEASDVLSNQHIFYINSFTYFYLVNYYAGEFFSPPVLGGFLCGGLFYRHLYSLEAFVPCKSHLYLGTKERPLLDSVTSFSPSPSTLVGS